MREDAAKGGDDEAQTQAARNATGNGFLKNVPLVIVAIRVGGLKHLKTRYSLGDKQLDVSRTDVVVEQESLHLATHAARIAEREEVVVERTDGRIMVVGRLNGRHDAR